MFGSDWRTLTRQLILPSGVAAMPDSAGYAWLRFLASRGGVSKDNAESSWTVAQTMLGDAICPRSSFINRYRLYEWLDWADVYLANTRSVKWLDRHVVYEGDPVPDKPAMAITLHYGAGLWSLRVLSRHYPLGWVHAPVSASVPKGEQLSAWLAGVRLATVRRIPGVQALSTPGAYAKMQECVNRGNGIVGLIDAPASGLRQSSVITVLNQEFSLANGLVRFALKHDMPVYLYTMSLTQAADQRVFRGRLLNGITELESAMFAIGTWISEEIMRDPAAWHLWRFADHFFVDGIA